MGSEANNSSTYLQARQPVFRVLLGQLWLIRWTPGLLRGLDQLW